MYFWTNAVSAPPLFFRLNRSLWLGEYGHDDSQWVTVARSASKRIKTIFFSFFLFFLPPLKNKKHLDFGPNAFGLCLLRLSTTSQKKFKNFKKSFPTTVTTTHKNPSHHNSKQPSLSGCLLGERQWF